MLGVWTDEKQRCDLSQSGECWQFLPFNPYTMKQLDLIFLPFFGLSLLVLILAVLAWAKFKKLTDANKNKTRRILDDCDLSQRYGEILHSEQPTFDVY
jgi:hypothetical protein